MRPPGIPGLLPILPVLLSILSSCRSSPAGAPGGPSPPAEVPPAEEKALPPGAPLGLGGVRETPLFLPTGRAALADADGDGRWDILLRDRLLLARGERLFQETRDLPWPRPGNFLLCDWDGDGGLDVLSASPVLHWWKGGKRSLFPLSDQGALLDAEGEPLRPHPGWEAALAALDADGDGRLDLVRGGPSGLEILLRDGKGRLRPSGFLLGERGRPLRPERPTSLAGFPHPGGGGACLAFFRGEPPRLALCRLENRKGPFRLRETASFPGPFPGLAYRAFFRGPLAALPRGKKEVLLLAGPAPRLLRWNGRAFLAAGPALRERTARLTLPGRAYPVLVPRRDGRFELLAGPGCLAFPGSPPGGPLGPPFPEPAPGLPLGGLGKELLLIRPAGTLALKTGAGEFRRLPGRRLRLLPRSRPALGDLDGDGRPDLAGFPGKGGFLQVWPGLPGGGFGPPRALKLSSRIQATLPTVLAAKGPGLALALQKEREDFFLQVEIRRPGPGPWGPGLLLRYRDEENLLLLQVEVPLGERPWGYRITLLETVEGKRRILARKKAGFPDGDWHTLAASLVGRRVRAWWDGEYLAQGRTALGPPGRTGLSAGPGRVHFKGFALLPPPGSPPSRERPHWKDSLLGRREAIGGSWHLTRDIPEPPGGILFAPADPNLPAPALAAVDWDRDGDLDILVGAAGFPLLWMEKKGPGEYRPARALRLVTGRPLKAGLLLDAPAAADLDSDGRTDLLLGDDEGRIRWFPGTLFLRPRP